jgi:alpha-1,3-rhamnosyl/mannosyltransferase
VAWRERVRRAWLARRSAQKATLVLADTTHGRGEILRHLGVLPARIRVVPPGVAVLGIASLPHHVIDSVREPTILFAGSIFNRRHLPDLIRAFAQIAPRHPDTRLEIVGENRTHPHQDLGALVSDLKLQDRVEIRSYESDAVLSQLYRKARVFAFLSEYEGFGLPPLEALAAGMPAVVTDTPVAREVCGDAARFAANGDVDGVVRHLEALLFDSQARRDVLDRAPAVLARYSWDRAARETLAALEEAAGPHSQIPIPARIPNPESRIPRHGSRD